MLEKIAKGLTRKPLFVLIVALALLVPSAIGFLATRVNYDILTYLPAEAESSQGIQLLEEPFHMAATSMLIIEDMPAAWSNDLLNEIKQIPGVSNTLWLSNIVGVQVPTDMIPAEFRDIFFSKEGSTMIIIQYEKAGASQETMDAIDAVRALLNDKCYLAGFSVVVKDTKELVDEELPVFVSLAVAFALAAMALCLESWVLPLVLIYIPMSGGLSGSVYTSKNYLDVTSDEFLDMIIEKGCSFAWYFHYMPVGMNASTELLLTPEQRMYMKDRVRWIRDIEDGKELFAIDFQNDGEFCGGCIAGGKRYCHINAAGDVEPCVFIHHSGANVNEQSLLDCLRQPLFLKYHENQPFNENLLRPCPMLENPEKLQEMIRETGARSTDLEAPESAEHLCGKCAEYAAAWAPVADADWAARHGV